MEKKHCYLCGSENIEDFFKLDGVPTQDGIMCPDKMSAREISKGNIELRFCKNCGYVGNEGYEAEKISFDTYDFSLDHSPMFSAFQEALCSGLIDRYKLKNKAILDIGCGDGRFLELICRKGNNKGIGIDSGFDHSNRKIKDEIDIEFRQEYYSEKHIDLNADFITCRLVVDLLEDPLAFLRTIRANLEDNPETVVYFEVPSAEYTFAEKVIWNVVYEHRSWFTKASIRYFFEQCGFQVLRTSYCWNDEFLSIEARSCNNTDKPELPPKNEVIRFSDILNVFKADFSKLVEYNNNKIRHLNESKRKVMAWGAGARALTFFNLFDLNGTVPFIVDINEKRQGKFLPGSAQEIVAPEFVRAYQPEVMIVTNPTYAREIKTHVHHLGVYPEFWVL